MRWRAERQGEHRTDDLVNERERERAETIGKTDNILIFERSCRRAWQIAHVRHRRG